VCFELRNRMLAIVHGPDFEPANFQDGLEEFADGLVCVNDQRRPGRL